ncbi:hypothetical protein KAR91_30890 [Candidatus Pacearchaeota archaeon]|nr:hypothetical protein [Candidatus Pacearchaeota archaeon]
MDKPKPVKLDIQNVKQQISADDVLFARKLSKKIIKHSQKKLDNGNIQIIIEIDPSIKVVKDE